MGLICLKFFTCTLVFLGGSMCETHLYLQRVTAKKYFLFGKTQESGIVPLVAKHFGMFALLAISVKMGELNFAFVYAEKYFQHLQLDSYLLSIVLLGMLMKHVTLVLVGN